MASISIIIPTHNRAATLMRPIESVLASPVADLEVIVVDDASTDQTAAVVSGFNDRRLRFERLPSKSNGNVARNLGVAASTGPIIAFLDSDDAFEPGRVERLICYFDRNPGIDAVLDGFAVVRGSRRQSAEVPSAVLSGADLSELLIRHSVPLTCSSIAVRRHALQAIGGFDENLARQQDRDLLLRLGRRHAVALGTGSDVVKHQSPDSLSRNSMGYVASLDQLVGRHWQFRAESFHDVLCYLAGRMILKDLLGGQLVSAFSEMRALSRSRHLPNSLLHCLLHHRRGRRARRVVSLYG